MYVNGVPQHNTTYYSEKNLTNGSILNTTGTRTEYVNAQPEYRTEYISRVDVEQEKRRISQKYPGSQTYIVESSPHKYHEQVKENTQHSMRNTQKVTSLRNNTIPQGLKLVRTY